MPRVAPVVPAESDLLCEGCGYTLNGLPKSGNCPECGRPIEQSVGTRRAPSGFELRPSIATFWQTTRAVIFRPAAFYRSLTTRAQTVEAATFARRHRMIAAALFWVAAVGHFGWIASTTYRMQIDTAMWLLPTIVVAGPVLIYHGLLGVTSLATWLSAIEARYWGMRLPQPIVRRGLQFHSACYVPVALLASTLVVGYQSLLYIGVLSWATATYYLYALCAAVIVSAAYLFRMYWIAMKSMMYANR